VGRVYSENSERKIVTWICMNGSSQASSVQPSQGPSSVNQSLQSRRVEAVGLVNCCALDSDQVAELRISLHHLESELLRGARTYIYIYPSLSVSISLTPS
jgi:hypothetical protein